MATTWTASRTSTSIAISNAGRSIDCTVDVYSNNAQSTHALGSGKYYVEFLLDTTDINIGVGTVGSGYDPETYVGQSGSAAFDPLNGGANDIAINGNFFTSGLSGGTAGDRICVALDVTNNKIYWRVNGGSWSNSGNPAANTGGSSYTYPATTYLAAQIGVTGSSLTLYTAVEDWVYQPPAGFGEVNSTPATLNPSDVNGTPTLSNSNRTIASGTDSIVHDARSTVGSSTPFYFEMLVGSAAANNLAFITNGTQSLSSLSDVDPNDGMVVTGDGYWYSDNVTAYDQFSTATPADGDRICIAVDPVNAKIWARRNNGTWNNSGTDNPATNTGGKSVPDFGSPLYAGASSRFTYITTTVYFAATDWTYQAPAGFGQLEESSSAATQWFQPNAFQMYPAAAGATSYTLTADVGSFAMTGVAASLLYSRLVGAGTGSFALTGIAANLARGYRVTADAGTFALTGIAASTLYGRLVAANVGAFTMTGIAAGMLASRILTASAGSFALTGIDAGLVTSRTLVAEAGSFTLTGNDATLTYASAGSYTLTADVGSFALAGNDAALTTSRLLTAEAGTFDLTGIAASLIYDGTPVVDPPGGGLSYGGGGSAPSRKKLQQILDEFRAEKRAEREKQREAVIAKRPRVLKAPPRAVIGPDHTSEDDDEEALSWILESTL